MDRSLRGRGVLYQDGRAGAERGGTFRFGTRAATLGFGSRALKIERTRRERERPVTRSARARACSVGRGEGRDPRADEALLVEGRFGVLALHDAGCASAVGVLGVGVTPRQLETAARFSPSRRAAWRRLPPRARRRRCAAASRRRGESGVDGGCAGRRRRDAADFWRAALHGETDAAIASAVRPCRRRRPGTTWTSRHPHRRGRRGVLVVLRAAGRDPPPGKLKEDCTPKIDEPETVQACGAGRGST